MVANHNTVQSIMGLRPLLDEPTIPCRVSMLQRVVSDLTAWAEANPGDPRETWKLVGLLESMLDNQPTPTPVPVAEWERPSWGSTVIPSR
ncbi:hypothetical protein [Curtobacterium sp. MCBD17_040]|uniref:hypothetical protein n=1 Tax=Curtobacterium sp. MCBD17_040 TaxID=2175674 RepID=UPI000DAAA6C4|nr:hypothetical protein [Curtobacterium sp. MCBD17_040]WIB65816.1 hypothetical protein DEI94_17020 [Curtobacterium sp. MCBD17_040]